MNNIKNYEIDWDKVKTIKDLKKFVAIMATRIVIDHDDQSDVELYETLDEYLVEVEVEPDIDAIKKKSQELLD